MRIGIVCYPTYGGSGVVATELAIELAKRGHDVHLICHQRPVRLDRVYPRLTFHGVEVTPYPIFTHPFYTLSLASKIYEVAKDHNLDIIHVHYAIPHAPAALLAKLMIKKGNIPKLITTLHGTDIYLLGLDPSYRELTKFSIQMSDGVTAVSNYLMRVTEEVFGLSGDNKRVIYNFVDPIRFTRKATSDLKRIYSQNGEKVVIHISNFREIKRIPDLIRVFGIISSKVLANLLLIGHGPAITLAEDMVKELRLSSQVYFLGEVNDVVPFLAASDLFLLTSQMESFGLAALEAMSCEVPVVASKVGGLPEVIEDGVSGFLVDFGDLETLAQRSLEILQNERLRREMGRAGRQIACGRFTIKTIVSQYEEYYAKVYNP